MDNTIRAAIDSWLPLIKGLSFDERVGFFIARRLNSVSPNESVSPNGIIAIRDSVRNDMIRLQNEALKSTKSGEPLELERQRQALRNAHSFKEPARTAASVRASIRALVDQGAPSAKISARIGKLVKELERLEK